MRITISTVTDPDFPQSILISHLPWFPLHTKLWDTHPHHWSHGIPVSHTNVWPCYHWPPTNTCSEMYKIVWKYVQSFIKISHIWLLKISSSLHLTYMASLGSGLIVCSFHQDFADSFTPEWFIHTYVVNIAVTLGAGLPSKDTCKTHQPEIQRQHV